jgi:hypothetical protein
VACFKSFYFPDPYQDFLMILLCAGLAMGAIPVGGFAPYMVPHSQALIHNEANSLLPIQNLLRSPGGCYRKPVCRVLGRYQKKTTTKKKL